jgi:Tfp pilus assembly protein PilF
VRTTFIGRIVEGIEINMKPKFWLVATLSVGLALPLAGCASTPVRKDVGRTMTTGGNRSDAKAQVEFGISVAKRGLWKEATQRWERATVTDPTYAAAWNNLGIGYEQLGRFDDARKAYEKALELDPGNTFIKTNYDLFREIYDRQNRRRGR